MGEMTAKAARQATRHIRALEKGLKRQGHDAEAIEAATTALREQIDDIVAAEAGPVGPDRMAAILAEAGDADAWADGPSPPRLGRWALALAVLTLIGSAAASFYAGALGTDGGAAFMSLGLLGFLGAVVLGWRDRHSGEGQAALWLSGTFLMLILAALIAALVIGD